MDMQGQRVLHVTQAQAWDALNDPAILKSCIPGCDKFEPSKLVLCLPSSLAK
jgi:carbon monoxide dehydrogenase subunit G